ncbi:hybrid sensor histidine kinase/response regulator [Alsobacter sp. SYSU M60028]|uniref:histidine kinase n=1 Tax=Alsobacter ponti TaxID=2962936 RepID=A0ABT1LIE8_9HYPH|nr:PAS domain-containing hybrid sensor histidine kinase/response regulator [Alsobacter ponti]MCP8940008.1 hybrid sensor histidine kinase/response regulator [Alsobacter ponti]
MLAGWSVVLAALAYLCALFAVAHYGDTAGRRWMAGPARATIYSLALGVYCTSWTFFGSVGSASRSGLDFVAIYIGPMIVLGLGLPLLRRVVRLAKSQNITSIADFVASRYGKSQRVAALVSLIAVIGSVPYIALQLKAVATSLTTLLDVIEPGGVTRTIPVVGDIALFIALVLAGFAMAFGTRYVDATEHQDGLMLAVAMESLVKLVAFIAVGLFVTFGLFDGFGDIVAKVAASPHLQPLTDRSAGWQPVLVTTLLSGLIIMLLPRQFHVMVVENRDEGDTRRASWMFPSYLVLINLFVIPIALGGDLLLPPDADRDMTVLALPLSQGKQLLALIAFIGGLSAATAMVIMESVALAVMISNDLVMPVLLRRRALSRGFGSGDMGGLLLIIRRVAILALLLLAYLYYENMGTAALSSIGLISFAAIAQIGPSFFGGLFWRRGNALGATAGLASGLLVWAVMLLVPSLAGDDWTQAIRAVWGDASPGDGFGFGTAEIMHGALWSLAINTTAYVAFSLARTATPIERLQASAFVSPEMPVMAQTFRLWRTSVSVEELRHTVARYLGREQTEASFDAFARSRGLVLERNQDADIHLLRFAEHLLASAIGASSSRLVLSLLLRRRNVTKKAALKLLDDASAAIQYNRDLLQHALDHARQGITVFDRDLRLMCWNREFQQLFELPVEMLHVGVGLDDIIRFNAESGAYGEGNPDEFITTRLESFVNDMEPVRLRLHSNGKAIEIRSAHMPDGGIVTTYTDITATVEAEEELERANETLERRVRERTEELLRLNGELERAKAEADEANLSKTRFLAAAGHDILQPLNAARLYATSLLERDRAAGDCTLAQNVDASLEAVEEILGALLEISRLDSGTMKAELTSFRIEEILNQLKLEFEPIAKAKGLRLVFAPCSLTVRSDRRLLRRLLQNLVSNAIKYTPQGRVLVGCRRLDGRLRVEVWDTGLGIPTSKQKAVFREFQRLDQGARVARGLGLGLSIVERLGRVMNHRVRLASTVGKGSMFSVEVPTAAPQPAMAAQRQAAPSVGAPLNGLAVLCIDNEPSILHGMMTLLSGWGCEVITAASLSEARAALDGRGPPDVIVADYHLDDGDGLAAIAALRGDFNLAVPAVLLTADRTLAVRDAAAEHSAHVLNKPLKPAALRALLAQWRTRLAAAE